MNNRLDKKRYSLWLTAPGFLIFGIIFVLPNLASFYFAFTRWNLRESTWTGLDNFVQFFTLYNTKDSLWNTFRFTFWETIIKVVFGLILAVALNSGIKTQGYLKSILFVPTLFGSVVVAAAWSSIMAPNGILNQFLGLFGVEPIKWLTSHEWAMFSVVVVNIWKGIGTTLVIYLGGLSAIPKTYYEAAAIDGVSPVQQFFKITLPLMVPSINSVLTLCLIGGLRTYDLIYSLTGGGPGFETEVLGSTVYKLFATGSYGIATAGYLIIFVLACVVVLPINHWVSKRTEDL